MVSNIIKNWETSKVDLPSTTKATLIVSIHGGQSVVIKNIGTAGSYIELYNQSNFLIDTGFRIFTRETATFTLPKSFGEDNILEVWGVPQTVGDDVSVAKILNTFPQIEPTVNIE